MTNICKQDKNGILFNEGTFNKCILVNTNAFREFIRQAIIPNINNDKLVQKWLFVCK